MTGTLRVSVQAGTKLVVWLGLRSFRHFLIFDLWRFNIFFFPLNDKVPVHIFFILNFRTFWGRAFHIFNIIEILIHKMSFIFRSMFAFFVGYSWTFAYRERGGP